MSKKIGWFCSYVPEELILAAGFDSVRIRGEVKEIREAGAYVHSNFCSYLKNILESGLRNTLGNFEGIIFTNSCDSMRRLFDLWNHYIPTPFTYMLDVPKNQNEHALEFFSAQIHDLKTELEKTFNLNITKEKLKKAISRVNNQRSIVEDIFDQQKNVPPHYKGSDLLSLSLETTALPMDRALETLEDFSTKQCIPASKREKLPRILIMGNVVDKPEFFTMVENAGASIIAFDTCNGLKHFQGLVEDDSDPIQSLSQRYLLKTPCARMPGYERRIERLEALIKEYAVEGIIYSSTKFCDYSLFETPHIEKYLNNIKLPLLTLENDYSWSDEGRIRTRVEAFVEMIAN